MYTYILWVLMSIQLPLITNLFTLALYVDMETELHYIMHAALKLRYCNYTYND